MPSKPLAVTTSTALRDSPNIYLPFNPAGNSPIGDRGGGLSPPPSRIIMLINNTKAFINARIREHPQIAPWLGDWSPDDETQIQIDTTDLEPCYASLRDTKPSHWTDGTYEYRNIRIPYGAMTDNPTFNDRQVIGPIHERWQYIGTTGWNWAQKKSMWVGFDFDSIANHNEGLTAEQLQTVLDRARELNYVTARTSKSGKGIHLIVRLNPQPITRNHHDHAQLAKHVLSRMSDDCGFDFHAAADCCGGILWHWQKGLNDAGLKRLD